MKKTLLLTTLLVLGCTAVCANPQGRPPMGPPPSGDRPCCEKPACPVEGPKVDIEKKLKLTPEQIAKSQALRMEAREQMRPIMYAIKTKTEQKEIIKHNASLTAAAQCEQVEKLNNQINELRKQADDIRMKNEKDFEALLTPKQKKVLDKVKADARKDMIKKHNKKGEHKQPPKGQNNCPPNCPPPNCPQPGVEK